MDRRTIPAHKSHLKSGLSRLAIKNGIGLALAAISFAISGCCTPFGPGCDPGHCYDCDGTNRPIPTGPFQGLKQQLTCGGGGCGEVYIGEWISTPPDCPDPCCDDQFVGGAAPCQTGCWTLGSLLAPGRFSGRFAEGRACGTCDSCCGSCDSCGDGAMIGESYLEGGYMEAPALGPSTGCATCSNNRIQSGLAQGRRPAQTQSSTRYAQTRQNQNQPWNQAQRIRTASSQAPYSNRTHNQLRSSQPRSASNSPMNQRGKQPMNPATNQPTNQRASQPESDSMVRYARAEIPQSTPARTSYAPRTGASRNRVSDQ